jgi:hypothetical protein
MNLPSVLDWLQHNKEWVFSGGGITVILGGIALFRWLFTSATPGAPIHRAPALQINLGFGGLTYDGPPYMSDQMLLFSIANPSERPVQLASIRVPLKGKTMVFQHLEGERRLPCMVDPGTNVKFWVPLSDVEATIQSHNFTGPIKIHAVASDALDNDYASNTVTLGSH